MKLVELCYLNLTKEDKIKLWNEFPIIAKGIKLSMCNNIDKYCKFRPVYFEYSNRIIEYSFIENIKQ